MQDLSVNKDLPSRIRFMLMDVIELRKSNVRNLNIDYTYRYVHIYGALLRRQSSIDQAKVV